MSDLDRLMAKVFKNPDTGCWEWQASAGRGGYGRIRVGSRKDGTRRWVRAHRWAYTLLVGEIPEGLVVRHKCDNPPCVNPDHMELGTQADNVRDRQARGRYVMPTRIRAYSERAECNHGHSLVAPNLCQTGSGRNCLACSRARAYASYAKTRGEIWSKEQKLAYANAKYAEIMSLEVAA